MPLVAVNKARRKPEWQDLRPPEKGLRDAYAIAARNVERWSRAFVDAARSVLTDDGMAELRRRYIAGKTPDQVVDALPWFNEATPDEEPWRSIRARLERAYGTVLNESEATELRVEPIEKAARRRPKKKPKKKRPRKRRPRVVPTVPVNPLSIKWAGERSSQLVREVSKTTKDTLRAIVADAQIRGLRVEDMAERVRSEVGLLERESAAVAKRRTLLEEQGFLPARVNRLAERYAAQLRTKRAKRIARTETIAAQNQGLLDKWRLANERGELPPVKRKWIAPPISDNPNRPCAICIELSQQDPIGLDESWDSAVLGEPVDAPPAHPHCRCTQVLRRVEA